MANIITRFQELMVKDRTSNKSFPCKTYLTKESAEKATAKAAQEYAECLLTGDDVQPADYIVFFVPQFDRWVGIINATEVLHRKGAGGYVGAAAGFYKF